MRSQAFWHNQLGSSLEWYDQYMMSGSVELCASVAKLHQRRWAGKPRPAAAGGLPSLEAA